MSEYDDKVTRYARTLWDQRHPGVGYMDDAVGKIEAEKGWGGCVTGGYGDHSGIFVYLGGEEVAEFKFYQLDEVLAGILDA